MNTKDKIIIGVIAVCFALLLSGSVFSYIGTENSNIQNFVHKDDVKEKETRDSIFVPESVEFFDEE